MPIPTIIVHGGAGAIMDQSWSVYQQGVHEAARLGQSMLECGASALDAAVAAVINLEDNETFNAGRGSALNQLGEVECDAFVMRSDLHSGAVSGISNVLNPVTLARAVLEQTPHHLLVGAGAMEFAKHCGVVLCQPQDLVTERRRIRYAELIKRGGDFATNFDPEASDDPVAAGTGDETCDTVGACAIDAGGRIAVAGSTGGIMLKMPGRAGDTPVVGSGSYCGPAGAITCTGHGEAVMRLCLAKYAYDLLERGSSAFEAAERAIDLLVERVQGVAGLIAVDSEGRRAWCTSTKRIAVGINEEVLDSRRGTREP
jgi:beta-aspartyl-peptidase (threonine type)